MSKKNPQVEVKANTITEKIDGLDQEVTELTIGKKSIGKIIPVEKGFTVQFPNAQSIFVKTEDEGFEALIRSWNLQD
ncbi:DUF2969 family protein [Enterococcus timonensis]|uniref:DUF2969 family protein n=1 Tax=Enterococcus timonensis TaxID=1852364 RepID=UPI0008D8F26C|nr:DUF2969 family protein [Enterococcus timonensis]